MIKWASGGKQSFQGKRVAISGSGNVAQYAALKVIELGGIVVSLSDSKGSLIATEGGVTPEQIARVAQLKVERKQLTEVVEAEGFKGKFKYVDGARPWKHVGKVDVALPSATQNEVSGDEAMALIEAGAKFIAEGSNMGCSQEAIDVFEENRKTKKGDAIWYAPGTYPSRLEPPCSLLHHCRPLHPWMQPHTNRRSNGSVFANNRQSRQRGRRRRLRARDGTELVANVVDVGGGGRQAQGHHGGLLQERARDGQEVRRAGRG